MKKVLGLVLTTSMLLAFSAQASENTLCTAADKTKIMAKDRETIQRVALQFSENATLHEKGIEKLQSTMKAQGYADSEAFLKSIENKEATADQLEILKIAGENNILSGRIQDLRPCLELAMKVLNLK